MYWVEVPPDLKAKAEALRKVAMAMPAGPEHKAERDAAWKAHDDAESYYFRLNMSGMGYWIDRMAEFGMVVDSNYPRDGWPDPGRFGTTHDQVEEECYDRANGYAEHPPSTPAVIAYLAAQDAFLRERFTDKPGIPVHKFFSNDGWIVTPEEIREALKVAPEVVLVERDGHKEPLLRWLPWLEFLRGGAVHGGVEVH